MRHVRTNLRSGLRNRLGSGLAALAVAAFTLSATASGASAAAEGLSYRAALKAESEVPPNDSQGTGEVSATYDPASKTLTWKGTYGGLTGPVTAAHFHGPAAPGANAGVLIPVTATASPFEGSAAIDDAKAADLAAGKVYFNLHTAANPKGEIRGQVVRAP